MTLPAVHQPQAEPGIPARGAQPSPAPLSVRERLDWTLRWQLLALTRAPLTPALERVMNAELRRAR